MQGDAGQLERGARKAFTKGFQGGREGIAQIEQFTGFQVRQVAVDQHQAALGVDQAREDAGAVVPHLRDQLARAAALAAIPAGNLVERPHGAELRLRAQRLVHRCRDLQCLRRQGRRVRGQGDQDLEIARAGQLLVEGARGVGDL